MPNPNIQTTPGACQHLRARSAREIRRGCRVKILVVDDNDAYRGDVWDGPDGGGTWCGGDALVDREQVRRSYAGARRDGDLHRIKPAVQH